MTRKVGQIIYQFVESAHCLEEPKRSTIPDHCRNHRFQASFSKLPIGHTGSQ